MSGLSKVCQSGRSMIEAIGYISVLIMISISISAAVNSGFYKYRQGRINQELTDLKKVISQRYVAAENYKDVRMSTLIDEKIMPYDTSDGTHSFSGNVKIGSGDANGTTFFIEFDSLPQDICVELGVRIWIVNDGSDLDAMKINNKTWAWEYSNSVDNASFKLPAKAADVASACTSKRDNKIIWYFN